MFNLFNLDFTPGCVLKFHRKVRYSPIDTIDLPHLNLNLQRHQKPSISAVPFFSGAVPDDDKCPRIYIAKEEKAVEPAACSPLWGYSGRETTPSTSTIDSTLRDAVNLPICVLVPASALGTSTHCTVLMLWRRTKKTILLLC